MDIHSNWFRWPCPRGQHTSSSSLTTYLALNQRSCHEVQLANRKLEIGADS